MKPNVAKPKKWNRHQEGHTVAASCCTGSLMDIVDGGPTYGLMTREQAYAEVLRRAARLAKK